MIAGGVASTYLVTGNAGVPLLFLVLGAVLALFVTGYAAMSHHITNAGAFYAYVSKGIGKVAGVGTSFVALIAYNSMQIGILGLFGAVFSGFMLDTGDLDLAVVHVGVRRDRRHRRPRLAARRPQREGPRDLPHAGDPRRPAVFDLVVAGDPAPRRHRQPTPSIPTSPSAPALGAALCFTMAAFVGFESAAIYGEECKEPRRTVAKATYIALGDHLDLLRALGLDARERGRLRRRHQRETLVEGGFTTPDGAAPDPTSILFITLDVQIEHVVADIATLLFCTSLFAASLSFHNAVSRYFFALGRARVLPSVFGRTRRNGAPYIGSLTQTLIAAVVIFIFWQSDNDPVLAAVHLADQPRRARRDRCCWRWPRSRSSATSAATRIRETHGRHGSRRRSPGLA